MHDGVRDLDAGGEAVDHHAAGERRETLDQRGVRGEFLIRAVHGSGQVALQGAEHLMQLRGVVAPHDQRARSEELGLQGLIGQEGLGRDGEQGGQGPTRFTGALAGRVGLDATPTGTRGEPLDVGLLDRRGEHHALGRGAELGGEMTGEGFRGRGADQQQQAGLRAELADTQRAGRPEAGGDGFATRGEGALEEDDGVDAAHLGVDRDGHLAGRGGVHEGAAAGARTGEADRTDGGVLGEELADLAAIALQHREGALGQARGAHGVHDQPTHEVGDAGMGVVRHHDDGAAGREGRSGVAAGDGIGEGEITRAEDGDRAEGPAHRAMVGLRERLALGVGGLDARIDPLTFLDEVGEEAELTHGPADLTEATRLGQGGLRLRACGQRRAGGLNAHRDIAQERGLGRAGQGGEDRRRRGGEISGRGDILGRGGVEKLREVVPRRRVERLPAEGAGTTADEAEVGQTEKGRGHVT